MIICFILPCLLTLFIMYLYPVARTLIMSFFRIESVTSDVSTWSFYGLGNYSRIFGSPTYRVSMWNMLRIWLVGGIFTLSFSLLFAVILTSGIRFKKFFRAAIYLPNVISAVALATMWIQYVYNNDYGMLNKILGALGLNGVKWLGTDTKFWAMLFAFIFGAVGYYMLIFISGIERIPQDLYEAATIDGANKVQQFGKITMPLLKGITKTNITFWSVHTTTFLQLCLLFLAHGPQRGLSHIGLQRIDGRHAHQGKGHDADRNQQQKHPYELSACLSDKKVMLHYSFHSH